MNLIKVNKASANYEINLKNAPNGTDVEKTSTGFIVKVPESSVSKGSSISFTASVVANKYNTYVYVSSVSGYQDMLSAYPEVTTDGINMTITRAADSAPKPDPKPEPLDPTTIVISKKDITNGEELPGATLVIKNSKGEVVETWVSTNEPKQIKVLPVGKYTLTETVAPEGYELSSETIEFEVKEDGKIKTVTMYNTPEKVEETVVKISKIDITTGNELPGATLVIKNAKGEVVEKWVSTSEPYIIKGLEEGTYTLEETIAPEGYKLSTETITFEVKNNETTKKDIMKSPEKKIKKRDVR